MTGIPSPSLELSTPPRVRQISRYDLDWALAQGWRDFKTKRGDILVLAVLYPLIGFLAAVVLLNDTMLPLFFPVVTGLSVMGPAVAAGYYEIARRHEQGLDSRWSHFFDPMRGRSRLSLSFLTLTLVSVFVAWLAVAYGIYALTVGSSEPLTVANFGERVFESAQGWTMIVVGNLVGLAFAALTLALTLVSFPLVVDKPVDALTAIETSLKAVKVNPGPTLSWGLRVAALLVLGALPIFIGLAVVLPVLGYATWHLYTRLVDR